MKASEWRDVYNTMPKGLCGGDQFTLIADLESLEAENARLVKQLFQETSRADKRTQEVVNLTASLAQANARLEVMREALKEVEWIRSLIAPQYCYCPICEHEQFTGHKDNCTMGKALTAQPKGDVRDATRDALESMVYQFAFKADNPPRITTGGLSALEEAFDILGYNDPQEMPESKCEYPGCSCMATCGTILKITGKYVRVCGEHFSVYHCLNLVENGKSSGVEG